MKRGKKLIEEKIKKDHEKSTFAFLFKKISLTEQK